MGVVMPNGTAGVRESGNRHSGGGGSGSNKRGGCGDGGGYGLRGTRARGGLLRAILVSAAVAFSQGSPDSEYLEEFFVELDGANWLDSTGWTSDSLTLEGKIGITAGTNANGTECVTRITLPSNDLVGTIPDVGEGQLECLERLQLAGNTITGGFPAGLSNLQGLRILDLSANTLTGEIPAELGSLPELLYLYLQDNGLSGSIPPELGNLGGLLQLDLENNNLDDVIPPELGNLLEMTHLDLTDNDLVGPIPSTFGNLVALKALYMGGNKLAGEIPVELGALAVDGADSEIEIDLRDNFLEGDIPDDLSVLYPARLYLSGNLMECCDPDETTDKGTAPPYPTPAPITPSPTSSPLSTPAPTTKPITVVPTPAPAAAPVTAATPLTEPPSDVGGTETPVSGGNDDDSGEGIDGGTVAGIAVGTIGVAALVFLGVCCYRRRSRETKRLEAYPGGGSGGDHSHAAVTGTGAGGDKPGINGGGAAGACSWMTNWVLSSLNKTKPSASAPPHSSCSSSASPSAGAGGINTGPGSPPLDPDTASTAGNHHRGVGVGVGVGIGEGVADVRGGGGGGGGGSSSLSSSASAVYQGALVRETAATTWLTGLSGSDRYHAADAGARASADPEIELGSPSHGSPSPAPPPSGPAPPPLPPRSKPSLEKSGGGSAFDSGNSHAFSSSGRVANKSSSAGTDTTGGEASFTPLATAAMTADPDCEARAPPPASATAADPGSGHAVQTGSPLTGRRREDGSDDEVQTGSPLTGRRDADAGAVDDGDGDGGGDGTGYRDVDAGPGGPSSSSSPAAAEPGGGARAPPVPEKVGEARRAGAGAARGGFGPYSRHPDRSQSTGDEAGRAAAAARVDPARSKSVDVSLPRTPPPPYASGAFSAPPPADAQSDLLGIPDGDPFDSNGRSSGGSGETSRGSSSVFNRRLDALLEAAKRISGAAQNSSIAGVPEVAMLVESLVTLSRDSRSNSSTFEASLKLFENLRIVLDQAGSLLHQDPSSAAARALLDGVQMEVYNVVEVMEAYQRKNRWTQIWKASIYRKRVEEAEDGVTRMLAIVNFAMQGQSLAETRAIRDLHGQSLTETRAIRENAARCELQDLAARRKKRIEDLIQEEAIPDAEIEINFDLVIGSGGAGKVYMANYAGVNAAAKVVEIGGEAGKAEQQRKSFLTEVKNMRRLNKSPRVVRVYGIVREHVLVMEYMSGGDLFSFIKKHRDEGLPEFSEELTRTLINDVAHGLAYLHQHDTWHGDLKSLNILLDAEKRAKISDFGTSHWTQETASKCLYSRVPEVSFNQFSFHWAAPEVLENGSPSVQLQKASHSSGLSQSDQGELHARVCSQSFMSDVYSFGIVVWEVLSREIPWAELAGSEMHRLVCVVGDRPAMLASAPPDLADLARACWRHDPESRLTCDQILAHLSGSRSAF